MVTDLSLTPKWRSFSGYFDVAPGTSKGTGDTLVWSVSPDEWTALGERPDSGVVDLTHVRAMFRLTGDDSTDVMSRLCSLDLGEGMFPNGAAARTLFAGVATELVRDDTADAPSYLILPSRSFGEYVHRVILDAGKEFGLVLGASGNE